MINKDRLSAITDGIIGVSATIMAFQLVIPDQASIEAFLAQFPILLTYVIAFAQIFLAWHEHHDAMFNVDHVNHRIFLINCLWLLFITMLPFATAMAGRSPDHRPSVLVFIFILFMEKLIIMLECAAIAKSSGQPIHDGPIISRLRRVTFAGYAVGAALTFIKPFAAFAAILVVSGMNVVMICIYDKKKEMERKAQANG